MGGAILYTQQDVEHWWNGTKDRTFCMKILRDAGVGFFARYKTWNTAFDSLPLAVQTALTNFYPDYMAHL
jgi:hypothetical protein